MRHKGRITEWQDERGFGFITPMADGDRVFVHITSFASRRRPAGNEVVTYELKPDPKGRLQAGNVRFAGEVARSASKPRSGVGSLLLAAAFLILLIAVVIDDRLPAFVMVGYVAVSAMTFLVYAWDKSAAKKNRWRTQESTLYLLGLLGGWPGALVAQKVLRHKSSKRRFQVVFWGTVVLNCAALIWVLANPGALPLISL